MTDTNVFQLSQPRNFCGPADRGLAQRPRQRFWSRPSRPKCGKNAPTKCACWRPDPVVSDLVSDVSLVATLAASGIRPA